MKDNSGNALVVSVRYGDESEEESVKYAIKVFQKKVRNSGLMQELFERRHYEKPSVKRRKKKMNARKLSKK